MPNEFRCRGQAWRRLAVACGLCLAASGAGAAVDCRGQSVTLDFGSLPGYNLMPQDASTAFLVTCSREGGPRRVDVTVGIGPSGHSGEIADRRMREVGSRDLLAYNIFRDPSMSAVWGETPGADTVTQQAEIPNKSSVQLRFVLYGRIPARQDVYPGRYSDTLTIRVDF